MQLSRFGQGLAVSAVSALVITGLAVSAPAVAAEGDGVRLLSQQDGIASVRSPLGFSFGMWFTLAAERLDPTATVSFEYNPDPAAADDAEGWVPVPSVNEETGPYVTIDWQPDPALLGTSIAVRAVATTPTGTTYATRNDVALSGNESEVDSVALGSAGLFFAQPYADSDRTQRLMAVSGSTSAVDGTVELSAWNPDAGRFEGSVEAAVTFMAGKLPGETGLPYASSRFNGVLDITAFDATEGEALALRAERDSDDVQAVLLRAQSITSISATTEEIAGPETAPVTVLVLDQDATPVAGAEVRRSADGTVVGYTDAHGQVVADQASGTTAGYYVNTTDVDAFEPETDLATEVVTPDYVPSAASVVAELADGAVFDDREYAEGDIALQVLDGRGEPYANQEYLTYTLHPTDGEPSEPVGIMTDEDGRFTVPFDPSGEDGEYTLAFSGPDGEPRETTFVAGDAELELTPLAGIALSGGEITYEGALTVEGLPLPDRHVDLAYTRGTEEAPGGASDAGILVGDERVLEDATTTDEDGAFTVTVADEVEAGGPAETGGTLEVTARGLGDEVVATADFTAVPTTPTTPPTTPTPTTTPTPIPTTTPTPTPDVAGKAVVELALTGSDTRGGADRLRVRGPKVAAGERVRIHVLTAGGFWRVVKGVDLDDKGDARVVLDDANGRKVTRYRVRLIPNPRVKAFTSRVLRLR